MRPTRYFIPLFFFFLYSNYLRVILAAFRTPVAHLLTTRLTINVFFFIHSIIKHYNHLRRMYRTDDTT